MDVGPDALPQPQRRVAIPPPADVLEFRVERERLSELLSGDPPPLDVETGDRGLVDRFRRTFRFDAAPGEDVTAEASVA
jgi:hypothetical protein